MQYSVISLAKSPIIAYNVRKLFPSWKEGDLEENLKAENNIVSARSKTSGQDLQYLRTNNLWALLSAVLEYGPISRFDLAHLTGLAPSSVTRLIRTLDELGLVVETGKGESSGGRLPILIVPNPDAGLVVSIDLSGPHVRGGVFDAGNNLIKGVDQPFDGLGPDAIHKQVFDLIHLLLTEPAAKDRPLLGIGVCQPGTIDLETGDIKDSYNLRLHNFPLRQFLNDEFGLPVYIEHDASVAAMAEQYYGAGKGLKYFLYILISTGIGSGIVIDNQIYRGETGLSGEFGHIILNPAGPLCVCGKRGCLEAVAAAPAMMSSARWMVTHGRAALLAQLCGDQPVKLTIENLGQAAHMGDPIAQEILATSADSVALGMTIYASLFDIRQMIVGGEVAELGDVFFTSLRHSVDKYCRSGLEIEIIPAELKQNTFLRGISMLTLQEVLRSQVQRLS
jgi:predicted NBD/HSP70 family sugar kinase